MASAPCSFHAAFPLFIQRVLGMMGKLILDVSAYDVYSLRADGKRSIRTLPAKVGFRRDAVTNQVRRRAFKVMGQLCDGDGGWNAR